MTWRNDLPPKADWYTTDRDPDLRRYFNGATWSPPVHVDSMDRHGARVRTMPAESQDIEWLPSVEPIRGPDESLRYKAMERALQAIVRIAATAADRCDGHPAIARAGSLAAAALDT